MTLPLDDLIIRQFSCQELIDATTNQQCEEANYIFVISNHVSPLSLRRLIMIRKSSNCPRTSAAVKSPAASPVAPTIAACSEAIAAGLNFRAERSLELNGAAAETMIATVADTVTNSLIELGCLSSGGAYLYAVGSTALCMTTSVGYSPVTTTAQDFQLGRFGGAIARVWCKL
jgi:hypothetical protein